MSGPAILITGFEPFGRETVNASREAAQRLDGWRCGDAVCVAHRLPCVYDACVAEFIEAFESLTEAVLMTGQAARRAASRATARASLAQLPAWAADFSVGRPHKDS